MRDAGTSTGLDLFRLRSVQVAQPPTPLPRKTSLFNSVFLCNTPLSLTIPTQQKLTEANTFQRLKYINLRSSDTISNPGWLTHYHCGFRIVYGYTASAKFSILLGSVAAFDCRICELPNVPLVVDYFRWRKAAIGCRLQFAHEGRLQ